ncbi:hypothetical protein PM082_008943 [Marasmius tenuissimus]|nr:hypothetical protein PM082_008943 [Marasmius tenuissimus]
MEPTIFHSGGLSRRQVLRTHGNLSEYGWGVSINLQLRSSQRATLPDHYLSDIYHWHSKPIHVCNPPTIPQDFAGLAGCRLIVDRTAAYNQGHCE